MIQDFESCDHKDFKRQLNTCHISPLWQISAKTSPLKFILLDGLVLKLQFQKLHWSLGFIKISPFRELVVSDISWQVLKSSDSQWQREILVCALRHERSSRRFSKSRGLSASVSFLPLPLPLFPLFGSRTIFRAGKTPKILFLWLSLLPKPTETLATQASLFNKQSVSGCVAKPEEGCQGL